ncbi:MAG: family 43 glycosylhydrolase [Deltaproteobacteria bacterium]|nr:family 43 glycosylhydrolase [Deltaproteobacteria bacterium]
MGDNPIVQTLYTADPAPMVYKDRLYVYTTHDEDNLVDNFFTMYDWRTYSTTDMVNWTDHGSPIHYKDFSWAKGDAWAAQCIPRNDRFYLYVPVKTSGGKGIGVAVADTPEGPFKDAIGKPLIDGGWDNIDPTVFIDDDGQAYLYWGNPQLKYVKLNEDMTSYSGQVQNVNQTPASFGTRSESDPDYPTTYEEGPWFYKRNDLYYMVFAAGPISEHIGYSTSSSPTGPWTYGGVVMPTAGSSFTNHPGVVDFKGKSYLFYHNGALPGGGGFHRSVCAAEFTYRSDGSIPEISMNSAKRPGVGSMNPYIQQEAETMAWQSGIETEPCSEGGMNVSEISNGDWIKVLGVNFKNGAGSFEARVASAGGGGKIEIRLDGESGTLAGTCDVLGTGDWQSWETVSCDVSGVTGMHDVYFKFTGNGNTLFNFNWWKFIP